MKTLTLFRHAKSGMSEPGRRDFDRPLNAKGERASAAMGRHLKSEGVGFDQVIASPATRVIDTLEHFGRAFGPLPEPKWDKQAYLASASGLLELIHGADDAHERLLIVGHNSGLEDLVLLLVPDRVEDLLRDGVEEKFPTASVAELRFDVPHWTDVAEGRAELTKFVRPRDLDPALGPDPDHN